MAAATETISVSVAQVQEFAVRGDAVHVQKPLDDALIRAQTNAVTNNAPTTLIVDIVPSTTATIPGSTRKITWSQAIIKEYLYPGGDSSRLQSQITIPMSTAADEAAANNTIPNVTFIVTPT